MKICPYFWRLLHGRRPKPAPVGQVYRPHLVPPKRASKVVPFRADQLKHNPRRN